MPTTQDWSPSAAGGAAGDGTAIRDEAPVGADVGAADDVLHDEAPGRNMFCVCSCACTSHVRAC